MRYTATLLVVLIGLFAQARGVQAQETKEMSAIDILDALTSQDPGMRDRGAGELALMSAATGDKLGGEILRVGVREAQSAIQALQVGNTAPCAIAVCGALDSTESEVRVAALDALVAMAPSAVSDASVKHMTPARQKALRALITESDYMKLQCEGVAVDESGALITPVRKALGLVILLDRVFGVKGMALLLNRVSGFMVGETPTDEKKLTTTQRITGERLRRGALKWCEAIWIEDPSIVFNYSAIAPHADRTKSVARITRRLEEMQSETVEYQELSFKGKRYGDYLYSIVEGSDISGNKAAAYLRLCWWRGDDVVIYGEAYPEAVDSFNKAPRREARRQVSAIRDWWKKHRAATE